MLYQATEPMNSGDVLFRPANEQDIPDARAILRRAADRMLTEGKKQWTADYPGERDVRADIERGAGYVLESSGIVNGYGAVIFAAEPAYNSIHGKWLTAGDYVVIHRLAVLQESERKGLGSKFIKAVEELARSKGVRSMRIDTNYDNERMLALIRKTGFTYCGEVFYERGSRMAFEKILPDTQDIIG